MGSRNQRSCNLSAQAGALAKELMYPDKTGAVGTSRRNDNFLEVLKQQSYLTMEAVRPPNHASPDRKPLGPSSSLSALAGERPLNHLIQRNVRINLAKMENLQKPSASSPSEAYGGTSGLGKRSKSILQLD